MEQGLVPAGPAWPWGSWDVAVAVQVTRGMWEALLHTCVSSGRGERLSRCSLCREGLFPRCAEDTKAALLTLLGVSSDSHSGPLVELWYSDLESLGSTHPWTFSAVSC